MTEALQGNATMVMALGATVVLAAMINAVAVRLKVPALVGYLLLGFAIRLADQQWMILSDLADSAFAVLAELGIVALLFKVGLDSRPKALVRKLPAATVIWLGNMLLAGALGFIAARYWLDLGLVTSLFVASALTATSVGVAVAGWEQVGAINSSDGELLVDVAELDDIAAIALMALLLALVPSLLNGEGLALSQISETALAFALKFSLFIGFCLLFSKFIERQITRMATRWERPPERMLTVVGVGFVIAGLAGWLGFSLAVGALFAGLVFSSDPDALKTEDAFNEVSAFLVPFFFIGIGLQLEPSALWSGLTLGPVLLLAAVAGKLVGTWLPARLVTSANGATLLSISMVPRAEIAMVIIYAGLQLGPQVVTPSVYAAMALVCAVTCVVAPLGLVPLLKKAGY